MIFHTDREWPSCDHGMHVHKIYKSHTAKEQKSLILIGTLLTSRTSTLLIQQLMKDILGSFSREMWRIGCCAHGGVASCLSSSCQSKNIWVMGQSEQCEWADLSSQRSCSLVWIKTQLVLMDRFTIYGALWDTQCVRLKLSFRYDIICIWALCEEQIISVFC